jgi:hypothetical protein
MKTERMVLLVTPEEKVRIGEGAAKLGVSASEYIRQLVNGFGADDLAALPELEAFWPEVDAAIERMSASLDHAIATLEEGEVRRAQLTSDAYREQVRRELLDCGIDWEAARRRFTGLDTNRAAA